MDAKPHYFKIGIFVLAAVILIVVAIILFGAGLFAQNKLYIESYFSEPITGLSEGSQVEFRGVLIGRVEQIGFVGSVYKLEPNTAAFVKYASYVRVVSGVLRSKLPEMNGQQVETVLKRMVNRGLRVRVSTNILTEQAYLEIDFLDPNRFPVESVPWVPRYPVIPSAPAQLTTIRESLEKILGQMQEIDVKGLVNSLEKVFTSLNTAISEAGLAELSMEARGLVRVSREKVEALDTEKINAGAQEFLASLNRSVNEANIPELSQQVRDVLAKADRQLTALDVERINADMTRLLESLNRAVADANVPALSRQAQGLMAQWRTTSEYLEKLLAPPPRVARPANVPEAVARLNQTILQLNKLLATESAEIAAVMADFRSIMDKLNDLVTSLEENPSELLFSRPPRRSEVVK